MLWLDVTCNAPHALRRLLERMTCRRGLFYMDAEERLAMKVMIKLCMDNKDQRKHVDLIDKAVSYK